MILQLRYNSTHKQPVKAGLIQSDSLSDWYAEIARLFIPLDSIECYVVPKSKADISPGGLFVILSEPMADISFQHPFKELITGTFIPMYAELYPVVSFQELESISIWYRQLFHPQLGLIGFEENDRIDLESLLNFEPVLDSDWTHAHAGLPQNPAFSSIYIQPPSEEEIMDAMKDGLQTDSIENIKKGDEKRNIFRKVLDWIIWILLWILLFPIALVNKFLRSFLSQASNPSANEKEGLLSRLERWVSANMKQIERQRESELKRLERMFDTNSDEALRYAIPLDSPYLDRGRAKATGRLIRRRNFSLGSAGGGGAVDGWDLGDHYVTLRRKYLATAQSEIAKGNHKKAAYVYAHLLGDFPSAATTLERGGYFREAAAIYKDHIKNNTLAAMSLEKGKLYTEAIQLYKEMNLHEKVGDLYTIIDKRKEATIYYENALSSKLDNDDFIGAGILVDEKMDQPDRASEILRDGWLHDRQPDKCLLQYFTVATRNEHTAMPSLVQEVYVEHTIPRKRKMFMEVLQQVFTYSKVSEDKLAYRSLAYRIASEELERKNDACLKELPMFFPGDKLMASDCKRYLINNKKTLHQPPISGSAYLDAGIHWIQAISHQYQFLAIGIKNNMLHMVRGNWDWHFEYYSWNLPYLSLNQYKLIHSPSSNDIIIQSNKGVAPATKHLTRDKHFHTSVHVHSLSWLSGKSGIVFLDEENVLSVFRNMGDQSVLQQFTLTGDLKRDLVCKYVDKGSIQTYFHANPSMIRIEEYYLVHADKAILFIEILTGEIHVSLLDTEIRIIGYTQQYPEQYLIISTVGGCILCKPRNRQLNETHSGFFAEDILPISIVFISQSRFVLLEKRKASLFQILEDRPSLMEEYSSAENLVAVLPTNKRGHFALLEEGGKIKLCVISED